MHVRASVALLARSVPAELETGESPVLPRLRLKLYISLADLLYWLDQHLSYWLDHIQQCWSSGTFNKNKQTNKRCIFCSTFGPVGPYFTLITVSKKIQSENAFLVATSHHVAVKDLLFNSILLKKYYKFKWSAWFELLFPIVFRHQLDSN